MPVKYCRYETFATVEKFSGEERSITLEETFEGVPVIAIEADAFKGSNVLSVKIPKSIRHIGDRAFADCNRLLMVTHSFEEYEGWSILPKGLVHIGDEAFIRSGIVKVRVLSETVKIGDRAFLECARLKMVKLPDCHSFAFGKGCFMNSSIERFSAPRSYDISLPADGFSRCTKLKEVDAGIRAVGNRCFCRCTMLKEFLFPPKLKIGIDAFEECTSLIIPGHINKLIHSDLETVEQPTDLVSCYHLENEIKRMKEREISAKNSKFRANGPVLFDLVLDNSKLARSCVKGRFYVCDEGFALEQEDGLHSLGIYRLSEGYKDKLKPLFEYLVKSEYEIAAEGIADGQTLHVYRLCGASEGRGSKSFLSETARKLLGKKADEEDREENKPFHFDSYYQMKTLFDIVKSVIPEWVRSAFLKNAAIYDEAKAGSDEQKHAETAMRYFLSIDWTPKALDISPNEEARALMDKYFYGLDAVKERILEVLTKIRKTKTLPKYGLLLNGPPGVGKTSIAKALAEVLCMPYMQFDMSTLGKNPDEMSGSSRVYANARPGRLANYMYDARSSTGIVVINELDKSDRCGISTSDVFLPILDRQGFDENFLQVQLPVGGLFPVATCNSTENISKPMLDRFLVIDIPAYTKVEKRVILTDYILPKVMKANGLDGEELSLSEEAIDLIIDEYAMEAGVRDLEKISERLCSHCNKFLSANPNIQSKCYSAEDIVELLGPFKRVTRKLVGYPGMITSAFYHENTAYTYLMEATIIPGTGKFEVLGGIPAQQREYCRAAYYCVRNRAAFDLSKFDVTVFSPQPIPDSASNQVGFACFAAICSGLTNDCLLPDNAVFLGGIDLYGNIFFDESDLTPLLKTMKASKMATLYAPMGTARKINMKELDDCNISIIEAPDAPALLTIAATGLKHAG